MSVLCLNAKYYELWYMFYVKLEIRYMERGICPIAVLYFAVKYSFFNIKNFVGQQGYQCNHMLGHVTSSVT